MRGGELDEIDRVGPYHIHERGVHRSVGLRVDLQRASRDQRQEQAGDGEVNRHRGEQRKRQSISPHVLSSSPS